MRGPIVWVPRGALCPNWTTSQALIKAADDNSSLSLSCSFSHVNRPRNKQTHKQILRADEKVFCLVLLF